MKLEGKVAIVTGGGQGIGKGIATCLAAEGADVAIISRSGDTAVEVAAEIETMGRRALALKTDVTNETEVSQAIEETANTFGKIDILINSVGGGSVDIGRFMDLDGSEWDRTFELNIKSQVHTCRAAIPHLLKQDSGRIVNISSIAGKKAMGSNAPYGTTKAGVNYLTMALASELGRDNITVNCVCPGGVYTPTFAALIDKHMIRPNADGTRMTPREFFEKFIIPSTPLKREITPEDIGRTVVFLVSDRAKNITGQTINISAGAALEVD